MLSTRYLDCEADVSGNENDGIEIHPETAEERFIFNAPANAGAGDPEKYHMSVDKSVVFGDHDSDDEARNLAAQYEARYGNDEIESTDDDDDDEEEYLQRPKKRARRSDDSEDVTTVLEENNTDGVSYTSVPDLEVEKLNTTKSQLVFVPGKTSCVRNIELSATDSETSYVYSLRVNLDKHINGSEQDWKDFQTVYYIMYAATWLASKASSMNFLPLALNPKVTPVFSK